MGEMNGRVCIVTGSNSGIGRETALAFANMGATVVMVVRNPERGERARREIINETGNRATDLMICNLSSMKSVRKFAKEFRSKYDRLHVLVNNAGVFVGKREFTVDDFERTLAVNYFAPFLLTHELLPLLKRSAPSRIINIGSGMHRSGRIDLDDLQCKKYNATKAYANSKLMLTTYTYELSRRLLGTGVTANVVEPGFAATDLGSNSGSLLYSLAYRMARPMQITAKKAAETPAYLASSMEVDCATGKCFHELKERTTAPASYDQQAQRLLYDTTLELLKLA